MSLQDLNEVLQLELHTLTELEEALREERGLLHADPSTEALERACERRQGITHRLLELRDRRRDLDPALSAASELWNRVLEQAQVCRALNDLVGAFVAHRAQRVSGMLEVLQGGRNVRNYAADATLAVEPALRVNARA